MELDKSLVSKLLELWAKVMVSCILIAQVHDALAKKSSKLIIHALHDLVCQIQWRPSLPF